MRESLGQSALPPELEDFANNVGTIIEHWGFKRVQGQMWTHLYLSKQPLDATQLMQRLCISKALTSITLKELSDFGVIEAAGKSPRGTKTYTALEDISGPILNTLRRRERRMVSNLVTSYSLLSRIDSNEIEDHGLEQSRMENIGSLINLVDIGLDRIIKRRWSAIAELIDFGSRLLNKTKAFPRANMPIQSQDNHDTYSSN
jgi:DNA-binding transcriptional regulator GbsR (MarR family)